MEATGIPKRAVIARTLPCRGCGYDLRGLRVEADCPECGRSVHETIDRAIDPDAPALPELHHPRVVGNMLVGLLGAQLIVMLLIVSGPVLTNVVQMVRGVSGPVASTSTPAGWALLLAAGISLAGIAAAWVLGSPGGGDDARALRRGAMTIVCGHLMTTGLLGLVFVLSRTWTLTDGGVVLSDASTEHALASLLLIAAAVVVFVGDAGLLKAVGARSRAYREASIARQGARAMVGTCVLAAAATLAIRLIDPRTGGVEEWLHTAARFAAMASIVMLVIGMAYLLLNAVWIRNGIRHPVGRYSHLVRIEMDSSLLSARSSQRSDPGGAERARSSE